MNFELHHYGESDFDISVDCALYDCHSISEIKGDTLVHLGPIGSVATTGGNMLQVEKENTEKTECSSP